MFASPGGGASREAAGRATPTAYVPLTGSPLINAGIDLATLGLDPGRQDLAGTPLVQAGRYDIGAFERPVLPGDVDCNDVVNFGDLLALAKNYNTATGATWERGDFNGDGAVNFSDLLVLAKNYNTSRVTSSAVQASASAEPIPQLQSVLEQFEEDPAGPCATGRSKHAGKVMRPPSIFRAAGPQRRLALGR
jgi:hypothetical protein